MGGSLAYIYSLPWHDQKGTPSLHMKPTLLSYFIISINDFSGAIAKLIPLSKMTLCYDSAILLLLNETLMLLTFQ